MVADDVRFVSLRPSLRPLWRLALSLGLAGCLWGAPAHAQDEQPADEAVNDAVESEALGQTDQEQVIVGVPIEGGTSDEGEAGEDVAVEGSADDADAEEGFRPSWAILPGPFYTQETGLGLGVLFTWTFKPEGRDAPAWPSILNLSASYTLNNQFLARFFPRFYLQDNDYFIDAYWEYKLYPNRFYGIGNDTPPNYQLYTESTIWFWTQAYRQVVRHFFIGIAHDLRWMNITDIEGVYNADNNEVPDAPNILNPTVPGYNGGWIHGLGLALLYDTRDNPFNPNRGSYLYTSFLGYPSWLGSGYELTRWTVDLRQYVTVVPSLRHVMAFQFFNELRTGNPPFWHMSQFGGPDRMRGYFEGRFRDRSMMALTAEYRAHIIWRIDLVAFGAVGQAYGESEFRFDNITWGAGGGIRFTFGQSAIVRVDFAWGGDDQTALIFKAGQAF